MSIWSSIGSIVSGVLHKGLKYFKTGDWIENAVKSYSGLFKYVPMAATLIGSLFNGKSGYAQNYLNGVTGAGLTNAQIQQNAFTMQQQQAQQAFNAHEAQLNRDWQERMSNTAYQRATSDMAAAGLNPAMMYGGSAASASTPSGSAASSAAPSGASPSNVSAGILDSLINVAFANERLRGLELENRGKELENAIASIDLSNQQSIIDANLANLRKSNEKMDSEIKVALQAVETGKADEALKRAGIEKSEADAALSWMHTIYQNQQNEYFEAVKGFRAALENLSVAKSEAEVQECYAKIGLLYAQTASEQQRKELISSEIGLNSEQLEKIRQDTANAKTQGKILQNQNVQEYQKALYAPVGARIAAIGALVDAANKVNGEYNFLYLDDVMRSAGTSPKKWYKGLVFPN